MERMKKMWNSFRAFVSRTVKEHRRTCIAAIAGTAVVLVGAGAVAVTRKVVDSGRQMADSVVTEQTNHRSQEEENPPDDDPASQIPSGYAGVIEGVLSTKGLTKSYRALGTSCETVLVGQRMIATEVVSRLDVGSRLVHWMINHGNLPVQPGCLIKIMRIFLLLWRRKLVEKIWKAGLWLPT